MLKRKSWKPGIATVMAGSLFLVGGCFGGRAQKPGDSLADAELEVTKAEQSRVGDYDATDLRAAKESLAAARAAANDKDKQALSRWLAASAKVDAELGLVRAENTRLRALTLALQREIDAHTAAPAAPAPTMEH